jgi:hypothetical protein
MALGLLVAIVLAALLRERTAAQQPAPEQAPATESAKQVPEGQTYVGTKECAACHFEQFMAWRQTPHAKAFEILPAKYQTDASCLKCHATGHGQPTGFTSLQQTPNLVGNSCEGCHGPGSKHTEVAKSFGQQKLTPEQETQVRGTVHLMLPRNVCVDCHLATKHQTHPPYDK